MLEGQPKRGRGRPRKYPPKAAGDFESTKYDNFFSNSSRAVQDEKPLDCDTFAKEIYKFIYESPTAEKLFCIPKNYKDNSILKNLAENEPIPDKIKSNKTCDDVFYEYLATYKNQTNRKYFSLLTKFVLLFRECYDISKNKDVKVEGERKRVTNNLSPEGLPDLCNEFYGEFMEPNSFFGINESEERNEIIEIIQHFCIWLFKNEYTKSKLSLAN